MIAMSDHYDRLENRPPAARESALFRDVRHVLTVAKPRVPALRAQLKGIDIGRLMSRLDLAAIPVIRQADLMARQEETPPLGGMVATRLGGLARIFLGRDGLIGVEGPAKDWWNTGRGLFAAGLRKGAIVLNGFSYDLVPDGPMFEAGARAIGAAVIAAGEADLDRVALVVRRLRPSFFCGSADRLKALLDHGIDRSIDMSSITHALVTGPLGLGLRRELTLRCVSVCQAFVSSQLGMVAFESGTNEGMTLNEGLVLELVTPGTGLPILPGASGEIVITRVNADYPTLRYGTGLLSTLLPQPADCGRTNMRIRVPRAPSVSPREPLPVSQAHIIELARRFPMLGRIRVAMHRRRERDELHLTIEHGGQVDTLGDRVRETLHLLTALPGTVEFVQPGSLADDDALIVDERMVN